MRNDAVDTRVQIRAVAGLAGYDQRGSRFVDQDRVDLVDDGVVQFALYIGLVGFTLGRVVHRAEHDTNRKAEEIVDVTHPFRIALRQVIVDGDDMDTLATDRIQIGRQRRYQGLTFTGAHFRDLVVMQYHAADELHVIVAHAERPDGGLAADGKSLVEQLLEVFTVRVALPEFFGFLL